MLLSILLALAVTPPTTTTIGSSDPVLTALAADKAAAEKRLEAAEARADAAVATCKAARADWGTASLELINLGQLPPAVPQSETARAMAAEKTKATNAAAAAKAKAKTAGGELSAAALMEATAEKELETIRSAYDTRSVQLRGGSNPEPMSYSLYGTGGSGYQPIAIDTSGMGSVVGLSSRSQGSGLGPLTCPEGLVIRDSRCVPKLPPLPAEFKGCFPSEFPAGT